MFAGIIFHLSFSDEQNGMLTIISKYHDGTNIKPNVCILYNEKWQETMRIKPESDICEFKDIKFGRYQVEIYKNDFWVGDSTNIILNETKLEKIIETKRQGALLFTVYYSDRSTKFPHATIKLYNHAHTLLASGISDDRGEVEFSGLWPNLHRGEYYQAIVELEGIVFGNQTNVNVDEEVSNPYEFVIKKERPSPGTLLQPLAPSSNTGNVLLIIGFLSASTGSVLMFATLRHRILGMMYRNSHYVMNLSKERQWILMRLARTNKKTGVPDVDFYYEEFPDEFQNKLNFGDYLSTIQKFEATGIIQKATEISGHITITDQARNAINTEFKILRLSKLAITSGIVAIGSILTSSLSQLPTIYILIIPIIAGLIQEIISNRRTED